MVWPKNGFWPMWHHGSQDRYLGEPDVARPARPAGGWLNADGLAKGSQKVSKKGLSCFDSDRSAQRLLPTAWAEHGFEGPSVRYIPKHLNSRRPLLLAFGIVTLDSWDRMHKGRTYAVISRKVSPWLHFKSCTCLRSGQQLCGRYCFRVLPTHVRYWFEDDIFFESLAEDTGSSSCGNLPF